MIDAESASPFYPGLDGFPLQAGQVFYGVAGQNPVTSPITVYWDAAGTQPAGQPIKVQNGRPVNNGAPARVFVSGDYSKLVQDVKGRQVLFEPAQSSRNMATLPFMQAGAPAIGRDAQDKAREVVSVADFGVRNTQSDIVNTTKLQAMFDYFAGTPIVADFREPIQLAGTVNWRSGISIRGTAFGSITATQAMGALFQSPLNELVEDSFAEGLPIFCAGKANTAFDMQCFRNFLISRVRIEDWLTDAVIAGNAAAAQSSYEMRTSYLWTHRRASAVPAGSRGLYLRAATDNKINNSRIVGGEVGVQADTGGNFYNDVHCWVRTSTGLMKKGFVGNNADQYYVNCYADTPSEHGFLLQQNNHMLTNCHVYNNGAVGDNIIVGVEVTSSDPRTSIINFQCEAVDAAHRIARDIKYPNFTALQSLTIVGNWGYNAVIRERQNFPNITSHFDITANGGFVASGSAGDGTRSLIFATGGASRFISRVSSDPETGANAGSNYQLSRRADDGTPLGTSIQVQRDNGTLIMTDGAVQVAGAWNKPFRMGTFYLWVEVATGVLRIKGSAPTADNDGTVVGSQA